MPRRALNTLQAKYAELLADGWKQADAYRSVYPGDYSDRACSVKASRLAKHPLVVEVRHRRIAIAVTAVDRAVERYQITQDRVADELARLAFTSMPQLADVRTVKESDGKMRQRVVIRDFVDADPEALKAIVEVKRTAGGEISIKLADKRAALMDLARFKGWIADKPVDQRQLVMLKIER